MRSTTGNAEGSPRFVSGAQLHGRTCVLAHMRAFKRVIPAVLALLAALCWCSASALASQHSRRPHRPMRPLVLHPRFHLVRGVSDVFTNGRYVYQASSASSGVLQGAGTVIDEQTGKRTFVSRPGCAVGGVRGQFSTTLTLAAGDPWLLFVCDQNAPVEPIELYSFATRQWRSVTPPPYSDPCPPGNVCAPSPIAVGADWIEYDVICGMEHCTDTYAFQNIATGQVQGPPMDWRAGGRTVPDLNSPTLARQLCSPLRVPRGNPGEDNISVPGHLSFAGPFAIAVDWSGIQSVQPYLERCGSRLHKPIDQNDYPLVANPRLVLWERSGGVSRRLDGLFLPSLRRLTLVLPSAPADPFRLVLSSRTLYEFESSGKLLATASPTLPRSRGTRH